MKPAEYTARLQVPGTTDTSFNYLNLRAGKRNAVPLYMGTLHNYHIFDAFAQPTGPLLLDDIVQ